jgi:hypothetical protein
MKRQRRGDRVMIRRWMRAYFFIFPDILIHARRRGHEWSD